MKGGLTRGGVDFQANFVPAFRTVRPGVRGNKLNEADDHRARRYAPGYHLFSDGPADFSYYSDNGDGTWSPLDAKAASNGGNLTTAQIASTYAGL
jgi:hypothetical protein